MSNFFNKVSGGTAVVGEAVYVTDLTEVRVAHDNFVNLTLYEDAACTVEISSDYYTPGEQKTFGTVTGYNKVTLQPSIYDHYTVVYASYTAMGDIVDAADINNKLDQVAAYTCGETIIAYRAVMLEDNELWYADMTKVADIRKVIGITSQSGNVGQKVKVYTGGQLTKSSWNWDTTKDIFISANGELTQTLPAGNIKIIAVPLSNTTVEIIKINEIIRSV